MIRILQNGICQELNGLLIPIIPLQPIETAQKIEE